MVERFWVGVSLIILIGLASLTARQVTVWHDEVSLWGHALAVTPTRPRPMLNLARAQLLVAESREALEQALVLNARGRAVTADPRRAHRRREWEMVADTNRALGLVALQRRSEARALVASLLRRDPTFEPAQRIARWLE